MKLSTALRKLFGMIILLPTLMSCKKDKYVEDEITAMLENKTWKLTYIVSATGDDLLHTKDSCQNDDLYVFNHGGNLKIDNASERCTGEEQAFNVTWYYDASKKTLSFSSPHISINYGTVYYNSDNEFTLIEQYDLFGITGSITTKFSSQ